jgi:hypothetical protein
MGCRGLLAKRKGSLRLTACLKVVIFAETGFYNHLSRFNFKRARSGSFYKSTFSMCAPKIEAAPVAGQALLPKKTLRRKVSLVKHYVRWANVCHRKANELTDVLKVPGLRTAYEPLLGVSFLLEICLHRRLTKKR